MKTHNGLKSNAKTVSIEVLNARLADGVDLALLTKQAHWNIKGPQFIALHEMIDSFRIEIDGHVDTIAERVVQLGGTAHGTTQAVAKATRLAPYPTDIHKSKDHLAALIDRYATAANHVREAIDQTDDAGDKDTADIFTAYSRALDKALWFLEALDFWRRPGPQTSLTSDLDIIRAREGASVRLQRPLAAGCSESAATRLHEQRNFQPWPNRPSNRPPKPAPKS